jgi:ankyrin repeat protein
MINDEEDCFIKGIIHDDTTAIIKCLNSSPSDLKRTNDMGETYLHIALLNRANFEILKLLIENGSNVNAQDINGETPLHVCLTFPDRKDEEEADYENIQDYFDYLRKIIPLLLENNANKTLKNVNGDTPYYQALESQHHSNVRFPKDILNLLRTKSYKIKKTIKIKNKKNKNTKKSKKQRTIKNERKKIYKSIIL